MPFMASTPKMAAVRWTPAEAELEGLTSERARDLIVTCFFEAQRETLARARMRMGRAPDLDTVRRDVETIVRSTFTESGFDYDAPTSPALVLVVTALAKKAQSWGTPKDIVLHHLQSIRRILARLGLQPTAEL